MSHLTVTILVVIVCAVGALSRTHDIQLFDYEQNQLTSAQLETLSYRDAALFSAELKGEPDASFAGRKGCKVFPGDAAWPSPRLWKTFDMLTGGALLKPVPAAHVCYGNSTSDAMACDLLTQTWSNPYSHLADPIEMFCGICQGLTCQPPSVFDSGTCRQGGYPLYTVNVSTVAHIQLAVNFARHTGIRLVIKNTGHDYNGKSGGAGSLSIWTYNLKDIFFIPRFDHSFSGYSGPAFKMGAGVHAFEMYAAARSQGMVVLGGDCPTVGIAGGYIQAGGHSPLSPILGMAADHVLAFEVVLANGQFVSANAHENSDLFWALRGGAGGFGVVTSVTVRAHPDVQVSTSAFTYTTATGIPHESFWAGVRGFFDELPRFADEGIYTFFLILADLPAAGEHLFNMAPLFAPNKTAAELESVLRPWFTNLESLGISINSTVEHFENFYDAWDSNFVPGSAGALGPPNGAVASRLWPRLNWEHESIADATFAEIRNTVEDGHDTFGHSVAPRWVHQGIDDTAVNPAWRHTVLHLMCDNHWPLTATPAEILAARKNFTYGHMQKWRDLSPGSGAYAVEADRLEPDFQWSFYGNKYPRLLQVKRKYDPHNLFWAATGVGSELFEVESVDGLSGENGRLCKKAQPSLYTPQA